jgi:hypothetical protein
MSSRVNEIPIKVVRDCDKKRVKKKAERTEWKSHEIGWRKRERGQAIEYEKKATNMRKLTEW